MKQVKTLSQERLTHLLNLATNEFNFFGKRTRDTRLTCAEQILRECELIAVVESADLVEWLADKKPVPVAKVKAEKLATLAEPLEPTFNGEIEHRDSKMEVLPAGVYIISSAQNNTLPHPFLLSLELLADTLDAKLLLMPIKYTTTLEGLERKTPTYDKAVKPYLLENNIWLGGRGLVRLAVEANIVPTAKQPINTAANLNSGEGLTIVASPKKQLKTLPRPKDGSHRWVYTTGTCTQRHYTDTRAGEEGCNSHVFGAIVVNVTQDGKIEHCEIVADESGAFYYGLYRYDGLELSQIHKTPALVLGDLHCEKMCQSSLARSLAQIEEYQPSQVILHDTLDFMSRNHHNRGSGRFLYQMGTRAVIDDLNDTVKIINEIAEQTDSVFIVCSNHDLALDSWLDCPNYRADSDIVNAKMYYFLKHAILECIDEGTDFIMLELALEKLVSQLDEPLADNVTFGRLDMSHKVQGFECGSHGHQGNSGARGSQRAFKMYQMPWISGHTHSPARDGDVLTVGVTGSLEMDYNKGGTSWDRANALIYPNQTAVLIPTYAIGEAQY
jgi:hypothetical protein